MGNWSVDLEIQKKRKMRERKSQKTLESKNSAPACMQCVSENGNIKTNTRSKNRDKKEIA